MAAPDRRCTHCASPVSVIFRGAGVPALLNKFHTLANKMRVSHSTALHLPSSLNRNEVSKASVYALARASKIVGERSAASLSQCCRYQTVHSNRLVAKAMVRLILARCSINTEQIIKKRALRHTVKDQVSTSTTVHASSGLGFFKF
jgi:hypothetical protein